MLRGAIAVKQIWCLLVLGLLCCTTSGDGQDTAGGSASFPVPFDTEPATAGLPMPADEAARTFQVPPGFQVSVFAAEPDIRNPIAMTWDGRGRLWVAENYTYADRKTTFDFSLRDRVLIFEDRDNDGHFDHRQVFTDEVQLLTSVEVGRGGVWLMTPPQLIFIPDQDRDDRPDSEPVVILDGFTPSRDNYHTFANGLRWGPDGWLYGRCGASSPGRVGVPGTPDEQRIPLNGGIWRYHPTTKAFEVLSHGTTNPWGLDWNSNGEGFFVNTVNGHLWQVIPGAHYKRPHSEDPNPHVYEMIDTHADHYHWDTGKDWTDSRNPVGEHDRRGGGHAHSGCLIYNGGQWPTEYDDKLMTLNFHGRRVNVERLEPLGAGTVARHEPDILKAADPWFRGIDLTSGPDGSVFILDWSDTGECHDSTGIHRSSGRIYKVTYGTPEAAKTVDLHQLSNSELIDLHRSRNPAGRTNQWIIRQARQELLSREGQLRRNPAEWERITAALFEDRDEDASRLERVQTLRGLSPLTQEQVEQLLRQTSAKSGGHAAPRYSALRVIAIQELAANSPLDTILGTRPSPDVVPSDKAIQRLVELARTETGGSELLAMASVIQRLPVDRRIEIARGIARNTAFADDHNLPLMLWYGLMPVANHAPQELASFAAECPFPTTRRLIARRLADMIDKQPSAIDHLLSRAAMQKASADRESLMSDILNGMDQAFTGRHKLTAPAHWNEFAKVAGSSASPNIQQSIRNLNLLFGDGRAMDEVRQIVRDGKAPMPQRKAALATLISLKPADLRTLCEEAMTVRSLNTVAITGLAEIDDPQLAQRLARSYRTFYPVERPALLDVLVSRPNFATALLHEIRDRKIPRTDLTPLHARQIRSFEKADLTKLLTEVWGELRDSPEDKLALIQKLKQQLTPEVLHSADKGQGRLVFNRTCATCHRLYGHGESIGPDLTGAGRGNLDYLLLNMVDPSATVGAEYRLSVIVLKDGRVLNGIVTSRNDQTLTLQTAKERTVIERSEIEEIKTSDKSLMPDGQLQTLTADEIRDLVAYLMHPVQVPLP
ncbi:MAG: PVC-type heme-binding CxxCH protein [Planctomycetaceae bacterium]